MKRTSGITFLSRFGMAVVVSATLAACGGGSGGSTSSDSDFVQAVGAPELDPADQVALDASETELLDQADGTLGGAGTFVAEDNGDLLPAVFPTATSVDLAYAQAGAAIVESLNDSLILSLIHI